MNDRGMGRAVRRGVVLLVALSLVLPVLPAAWYAAAATIRCVNPPSGATGCDATYGTIGAAITAAAASGDTIAVYSGTYAEHLSIGKSLTLQGIGGVILAGDGVTLGAPLLTVSGSTVTVVIINLTISGGYATNGGGIRMTDLEVKSYRVEAERGISGEVYMSGKASILQDAAEDPRALAEHLPGLRIRNGVSVPLVVEKRDDDNRLVEQLRIGVLHCFNKRYGAEFIEEDVRLLERLSRNAAAVIANAQMYQEVVEEKQKLVHTLESLTAGLILINQHGRISQMNAQARSMFGIGADQDPLHKPFVDIIQHEQCVAILSRKIEEASNPRPPSAEDDI